MPKRKETTDFETPFSEEEDLDFGVEELLFPSPPRNSRLGPVPEAPPHPSLRSMGVREMARRDAEDMARHRTQSRQARSEAVPSNSSTRSYQSNQSNDDGNLDSHLASDYEIPHLSSEWGLPPSTNSSSLDASGFDVPRLSASTKEWWDRLGQRDESPSL